MSYKVLARKWRPRFFREMVGQEHVLQALINALDHNRLHHAYLFTGTRGVGKTTIARILAKCLNCDVGVSSEPCGQCSACLDINNSCFIDLIEVDAASNTGVDDIREIIDNAQYRPTRGRYKVYIIDEVHMLSKNAFNALLKTLEEPPEHVKFLLATTDPQKLPATILSRCLQFHLKNMAPERIVRHLQYVLEQELIESEEQALWALARAAEGSMRDALSLTDQAIAYGSNKVLESQVRAMLGTIDQQTVLSLVQGLIAHDAVNMLASIDECSMQSPDYLGVLDELLMVLHRMTVAQVAPDALDNSLGDRERIIELAQQVTPEELQLFYQMGILAKRDMTLSPDLRSGLEMAVLRMLVFRPAGIAEPPSKVLANSAVTCSVQVDAVKKPNAVASASVFDAAAMDEKPTKIPAPAPESVVLESVKVVDAPVVADAAPSVLEVIEKQPVNDQVNLVDIQGNDQWLSAFVRLGFSGLLRSVLAECVLVKISDQGLHWHLIVNANNAQLYNSKHAEQMAEHVSRYFSQSIRVDIEEGVSEAQTPSQYLQAIKQTIHDNALKRLQQDPLVQFIEQTFNGQMDNDSIKAIIEEVQ